MDLEPGQVIAERFTLQQRLGTGGMGEVWLATDARLQVDVALKLLSPVLAAEPGMVDLLKNECRNARKLAHPNIVTVYDFHSSGDLHFISMAYVQGADLQELLEQRKTFGVDEVRAIVNPLLNALEYAHRLGIVHRDVKCGNVLVDAARNAWLTDFGIASAIQQQTGSWSITSGGSLYSMSPQQLDRMAPSPSDDIYALGVMLYQLLSGNPPFYPGIDEEQIRASIPPPLSRFRPELAGPLDQLISSMLAKDPQKRPRDISEVRAALSSSTAGGRPAITAAAATAARSTPLDGLGVGNSSKPAAEEILQSIEPITPVKPVVPGSAPEESGSKPDVVKWVFLALVLVSLVGGGILFFSALGKLDIRTKLAALLEKPAPAPAPDPVPTPVPDPTPVPKPVDPPPVTDPETLAAKAEAEELFITFTGKKNKLDGIAAGEWGGDAYTEMMKHSAAADEGMLSRDFIAARDAFKLAIVQADLLAGRTEEAYRRMIDEGRLAMSEGRGADAVRKFETALKLKPGDAFAEKFLARAKVTDQVWALLEEGRKREEDGELRRALTSYQEARGLDPEFNEVNAALARVRMAIDEDIFKKTMSAGLNALSRGDYEAAKSQLAKALAFKPGMKEIQDALLQAEEGLQQKKILALEQAARELEAEEQWEPALDTYIEILVIDDTVAVAREARDRLKRYIEVNKKMAVYARNTKLLETKAGLQAARELMLEVAAMKITATKLAANFKAFQSLVTRFATPVQMVFKSDGKTKMDIYQVGRFPAFDTRTVPMTAGTYTVVAYRPGYRDVRLKIKVKAGQEPETITVVCKEKI